MKNTHSHAYSSILGNRPVVDAFLLLRDIQAKRKSLCEIRLIQQQKWKSIETKNKNCSQKKKMKMIESIPA